MVTELLVVAALASPPQRHPPVIDVPPANELQEMVLQDGVHAIGRVERVTDGIVTFRKISGDVLEVESSRVVSISLIDGRSVNGTFWPTDPNSTRLLLGPTGRSLKQGQAYLDIVGILPYVQVGVTDRVSIGGGTPLFFPGSERVFWVTPKVQIFAGQKTEAAIGTLHIANVGHNSFGIAYGVLTRGSPDAAVTVGLGYSYEGDRSFGGGAPVGIVGGERRVSHMVKLITENYVFSGGGIASAGVRLLGERWAVNLGVTATFADRYFFAAPTVRTTWKF